MINLLKGSVINKVVKVDREYKRLSDDSPDVIIKGPHMLMLKPIRPLIMIRDPRSIITSKMGTHTDNPTDYFCSMSDCTGKKKAGALQMYWVVMNLRRSRKALVIKYEDLISHPAWIQSRVGGFWGLEYDRCWTHYPTGWGTEYLKLWDHKLNGVRRLDSGHEWRDHIKRVKQQFEEHPEMQEILEIFGYEKNDSWLDEHGIERPGWMPPHEDRIVITPGANE